jgi:uncharacterized membrane protein YgdD (TMEM256/DUF423 family)
LEQDLSDDTAGETSMADAPPPSPSPAADAGWTPSPFSIAFAWSVLGLVVGGFLDASREAERLQTDVIGPIDAGAGVVRTVTVLSLVLAALLVVLQIGVGREPSVRSTAGIALLVGTVLYAGCVAVFVVSGMPLWLGVIGPWGKALLFVLFAQGVACAWTALVWYRKAG